MIRCNNNKCDAAVESHPVENRESWEFAWDKGWLCPHHTSTAVRAREIEASKARHPANGGTV